MPADDYRVSGVSNRSDLELLGDDFAPPRRLTGRGRASVARREDPLLNTYLQRAQDQDPDDRCGLSPLGFPLTWVSRQTCLVEAWPQIPMCGPYRLFLNNLECVRIVDFQIGNCSLMLAPGSVRADYFRERLPAPEPLGGLRFGGPVCRPGLLVRLMVASASDVPLPVEATLWGRTVESMQLRKKLGLGVVEEVRLMLEEERRFYLEQQALEQALAKALEPAAAPARPELPPASVITAREYLWRQQRDADREASAAHAAANPSPPRLEPEPEREWWQEQWSTATDES